MSTVAPQRAPHPTSGVVSCRAETTFSAFVEAVEAAGWSVDGIQPEAAGSTLGSLLSRRQPRPVHWGCGLLPSRVVSLTARPHGGPTYVSITAPRKSSGPDLAYLFIGGEGLFGEIAGASFSLVRPAPEYLRAEGQFEDEAAALVAVRGVARIDPLSVRHFDLEQRSVEAWVPVRTASIDTVAGALEAFDLSVEASGTVPLNARYRPDDSSRPSAIISCRYAVMPQLRELADSIRGRRKLSYSATHTDQHGLCVRVSGSEKSVELVEKLAGKALEKGEFDDASVAGSSPQGWAEVAS